MTGNEQEPDSVLSLSRKYLLVIFVTTVVVRIVCMVILRSWNFYDHWSFGWEIGKIGQSLALGHGISVENIPHPLAKFPPVYPLLVGGVFAVFGVYSTASAIVLFLLQSVFSAFTATFLAILGSHFFGRKEGLIAGFVWAFYPSSILYSVKFVWYSELAVMLVLLIIIVASTLRSSSLLSRIACLGALSGLIVLTDSTMAIYPALLFVWMMYARKLTLKKWIFNGVIWFVAFGVIVSPWAIRNWLVMENPGILKSNFGLELFFGNNPYSTGGGINKERRMAEDALDQMELNHYRQQSEYVYYGYLQKKALAWIRTHPARFLQLSAKRAWFFWGKFPSSGPGPWKRHTWMQLAWYVPVALLALCSMSYFTGRRLDLIHIWLFLLLYPLPFYFTHVQLYRYRYPVEPFLVLLAAIPLAGLLTRFWGRLTKRHTVE
jgi:4-amino-4-deoxy-L-arabinose transferase-like glycosyltransferase